MIALQRSSRIQETLTLWSCVHNIIIIRSFFPTSLLLYFPTYLLPYFPTSIIPYLPISLLLYVPYFIHWDSFEHLQVSAKPFLALCTSWRILHILLGILEPSVERRRKSSLKKNYLDNEVSDLWKNCLYRPWNYLENKYFLTQTSRE